MLNSNCMNFTHKVKLIEIKTDIICNILSHTKILIELVFLIIRLSNIVRKKHTNNITKIVTQRICIIIKLI